MLSADHIPQIVYVYMKSQYEAKQSTVKDDATNLRDTFTSVTRGPSVLVVRCTCHFLWLICCCSECGRLMMSVIRTKHNSYHTLWVECQIHDCWYSFLSSAWSCTDTLLWEYNQQIAYENVWIHYIIITVNCLHVSVTFCGHLQGRVSMKGVYHKYNQSNIHI